MAGFSPSTFVLLQALSGAGGGGSDPSGGFVYKGSVNTDADLPSGSANKGDMYTVLQPTPHRAVYDGGTWVKFDSNPVNVSDLVNDAWYLSSRQTSGKYVDNIYIDGSGTMPSDSMNLHKYLIKDIQFKRGTSASSLATLVPKAGEPVFEYNTASKSYKLKIGDGTTKYSDLKYIGSDFTPAVDGRSVIDQAGTIQIFGFATAPAGAIPRKAATGNLEWVNSIYVFKDGKATTTKLDTSNNVTVDVNIDNSTIKVDGSNRLSVPIDNDTLKVSGGKLIARQVEEGPGIRVTTAGGKTVVSSKLVAGANVSLNTAADGTITIGATGSAGGDKIEAGTGINIKANAATGTKTISTKYVAGTNIQFNDLGTDKIAISVDPTAINNTVRPIQLNGAELLDSTSITTPVNFASNSLDPAAIDMIGAGNKIEMAIANKNIIQVNDNEILTNLKNFTVTLDCGGAGANW